MTKYGDEVATCGQNSEFEDHLQLEGLPDTSLQRQTQ
jgi:hypothetical protein